MTSAAAQTRANTARTLAMRCGRFHDGAALRAARLAASEADMGRAFLMVGEAGDETNGRERAFVLA
jgi:hypothetical protein